MNYSKKLFCILLFLFLYLPLAAQVKNLVNPQRTFDVQHYIIRSDFNRQTKTLFGDTTIILKPLNANFSQISLDAVGMRFHSVKLGIDDSGENLKFSSTSNKLTINLNKVYSPEEEITVRIKYTASPRKGVYFIDAEKFDTYTSPAQIWTQGEPDEIRHWFPSYDLPDDKATSEQFITTRINETAIANGELLEIKQNANNTKTFHYKMPIVHSVYLTSMIVGEYVKVEEKYKDTPLTYYVYRGMEGIVPKAYAKTPEMMRVFEEITGINYPYNKYDQTIVSGFTFGGMENITATTMADTEILAANFDYSRDSVIDLVSHELAHSWFGNLVTTKDWSNLWLNEGFASYLEAVFREKINGRVDYLKKIKEDSLSYKIEDAVSKNRHPLFRLNPPMNNSLFDTTTYQKGSAVLHTLREEIGDESFWKAVNLYLNRHKFGNVVTQDLQTAMEEVSQSKLDWFFDQWIYKIGYPQLSIRHKYNTANKTLSLNIIQNQRGLNVPKAFILPLDVEIQTKDGVNKQKIRLNKRIQNFQFKVSKKPTNILIDSDEKIPLKLVAFFPEFSS